MQNNIEQIRHSLAHLLAAAVIELYPGAKPTIGPAIETGFYYDFDLPTAISDKELLKIENKMREIVKSWKSFSSSEKTAAEAEAFFSDNPYKLELIKELATKGETLSFYTSGTFTDLCRGGHAENPAKDIGAAGWKLDRVAGAYWRGSEANKMLTRIYGLAFETKDALKEYETQLAEAEKRDHRKLGKELEIYIFDEDTGPGLPLWMPNGTVIIEELEKLAKEKEFEGGYLRVRTPHLAKESMYLKSGHLPYYEESM